MCSVLTATRNHLATPSGAGPVLLDIGLGGIQGVPIVWVLHHCVRLAEFKPLTVT
jgi:hypothetical protein